MTFHLDLPANNNELPCQVSLQQFERFKLYHLDKIQKNGQTDRHTDTVIQYIPRPSYQGSKEHTRCTVIAEQTYTFHTYRNFDGHQNPQLCLPQTDLNRYSTFSSLQSVTQFCYKAVTRHLINICRTLKPKKRNSQ